jgi:hypothetical protein
MIWQKVDPALANAMGSSQDLDTPQFSVFIQTSKTPGPSEYDFLSRLGVPTGRCNAQKQVFTATVSARDIHSLSDQSWVQALRLSRRLQIAVNT